MTDTGHYLPKIALGWKWSSSNGKPAFPLFTMMSHNPKERPDLKNVLYKLRALTGEKAINGSLGLLLFLLTILVLFELQDVTTSFVLYYFVRAIE